MRAHARVCVLELMYKLQVLLNCSPLSLPLPPSSSTPGADPTKCKAHGPGLQDGNVGDPGWFIIETRDAGAGTLQVRLHGVKDAFKIDIKPKDSKDMRTLEARYDATKPGDYLITIKWSDVHIPGVYVYACVCVCMCVFVCACLYLLLSLPL